MENPNPTNSESTSETRKRKRIQNLKNCRWKSQTNQNQYSSKLLEALRHVKLSNPDPKTRLVREAADRALAIAARGRTRWSRSILAKKSLKIRSCKRKPRCSVPSRNTGQNSGNSTSTGPGELERKARVLGRLVPGCRKLEFPKLLEETTDYIAALEMQVRAMSALAQLLSGLDSGSNRNGLD